MGKKKMMMTGAGDKIWKSIIGVDIQKREGADITIGNPTSSNQLRGIDLSPDGIYLTTSWYGPDDISTSTLANPFDITTDPIEMTTTSSLNSQPGALAWNADGTRVYNAQLKTPIQQAVTSVPYKAAPRSNQTTPISLETTSYRLCFQWCDEGRKFIVTNRSQHVELFECPTPYDLTGATRTWNSYVTDGSQSTQGFFYINDGMQGINYKSGGIVHLVSFDSPYQAAQYATYISAFNANLLGDSVPTVTNNYYTTALIYNGKTGNVITTGGSTSQIAIIRFDLN